MLSPRARVGRSGEIAAAAELGKRGYRIVASNYRCKSGEIDLIAEESGHLVFIEVRAKRTNSYGSPAESVTHVKQQRLLASAQFYLEEKGIGDIPCRFDVVEVTLQNGRLAVSDVIRDAFSS